VEADKLPAINVNVHRQYTSYNTKVQVIIEKYIVRPARKVQTQADMWVWRREIPVLTVDGKGIMQ